MSDFYSYPVFKGMQKPLEFMAIRGKYIYYAFGLFILSFVAFTIGSVIGKTLVGFICFVAVAIPGLIFIYVKQKLGLHSKRRYKGVVHYTGLFEQ